MSTRTKYFKLHEDDNNGMFDEQMFKKAPVILFEVPTDGPAAVYFLVGQSKIRDYNEVGMMEIKDFVKPKNLKKITAAEFKRMTA